MSGPGDWFVMVTFRRLLRTVSFVSAVGRFRTSSPRSEATEKEELLTFLLWRGVGRPKMLGGGILVDE